ncbi:hypothetical protein RND81_05G150800 [Saponaria officinalis]|uniref:Transcription repressor n=1 Tax=Saponaria officinalis TaxID=3572 RepID=A0AAW1KWW7_SAPOF
MPRIFKKNLHLCFFKINCLPTHFSPPFTLEDDNYPHNNFTNNKNNINNKAEIIMKSYNSIYDDLYTTPTTFTTTSSSSTSTSTDDNYETDPAAFPTVSQRFFVSSPGSSNSILDYSTSASSSTDDDVVRKKRNGGGVPVKKYSSDPYTDFRRSMLEMIRARESELYHQGGRIRYEDSNDWEFFQELILSYLSLNPKKTHKLIIRAFSDVLVSLALDHHQCLASAC